MVPYTISLTYQQYAESTTPGIVDRGEASLDDEYFRKF